MKRHRDNHKNSVLPPTQLSQNMLYECKECPYSSRIRNHFEIHSLRHRKPEEVLMHKCDQCNYETKFRDRIMAHRRMHDKYTFFSCHNCTYKVRSKKLLGQHMVLHRGQHKVTDDNFYECLLCTYKTDSKGRLLRHLINVHGDPALHRQQYKCSQCDFQTFNKANMKGHEICHKKSTKLLSCQSCTYTTYDIYNFRKHNATHKRLIKCDHCDYRSTRGTLNKHILTHQTSLFYCYQCSYKTNLKPYLIHHMKVHQPSEPIYYRCERCGFETKDRKSYRKHVLNHEDSDECGFHNCKQCDFKTKYKKILLRHVQTHEKFK